MCEDEDDSNADLPLNSYRHHLLLLLHHLHPASPPCHTPIPSPPCLSSSSPSPPCLSSSSQSPPCLSSASLLRSPTPSSFSFIQSPPPSPRLSSPLQQLHLTTSHFLIDHLLYPLCLPLGFSFSSPLLTHFLILLPPYFHFLQPHHTAPLLLLLLLPTPPSSRNNSFSYHLISPITRPSKSSAA
ncbi:hypothetical protein Pmani_024553 [Petrolisthes manimaculis]|uniref:Uncharacterized protein n=1 Tax=Petrolisthes manimaculis TaxID=1843537 RepID=A0AAE1P9U6_9EUCA|nr:hypothetical protein Pmani_024553 [Petrolisthes manimaculis]